ncbi:conserved hypothetical protein [Planktothrix sp. PCC 11201]|uniref:hypothetical protein n=2 Tax=Planktothrix sp. PCC 11201 TaxID=1729650 RepID=UPI000921318E|nr:hypothetical protein [Planktothrix sp. PCC 11201]SKB14209.1 conserved hypothetical protein [Planktothrix sp. PCC 11201]
MGYSVINPNSQVEAIKQNWKTHHLINLVLLTTSLPFWFFTPFLTRDVNANNWHKFFRFTSITYAILASGTSLYLTTKLGEIKPKIDAIKKREQAEFKHSLASDLFLAQGTNTAIAQYLLTDRTTSLTSQGVSDSEVTLDGDTTDFSEETSGTSQTPEVGTSDLPVRGSKPETGLSVEAEEMFELVIDALEDGYSDTKIVEELMGYKGRNYKKGKMVLSEIKRFLELD